MEKFRKLSEVRGKEGERTSEKVEAEGEIHCQKLALDENLPMEKSLKANW